MVQGSRAEVAKQQMKGCSRALGIAERHLETTVSDHPMAIRMAAIQKQPRDTCGRGCGEAGTRVRCWQDRKMAPPSRKTVWSFPQKTEDRTVACHPTNPPLGEYPKGLRAGPRRNHRTPVSVAASSTLGHRWEQCACPAGHGWVKKAWLIQTRAGSSDAKLCFLPQ